MSPWYEENRESKNRTASPVRSKWSPGLWSITMTTHFPSPALMGSVMTDACHSHRENMEIKGPPRTLAPAMDKTSFWEWPRFAFAKLKACDPAVVKVSLGPVIKGVTCQERTVFQRNNSVTLCWLNKRNCALIKPPSLQLLVAMSIPEMEGSSCPLAAFGQKILGLGAHFPFE